MFMLISGKQQDRKFWNKENSWCSSFCSIWLQVRLRVFWVSASREGEKCLHEISRSSFTDLNVQVR